MTLIASLLLVALVLVSCGSGSGRSCADFAGNYEGFARDDVSGDVAEIFLGIVQAGCSLGGSALICDAGGECGSTEIAGSGRGERVDLTLQNPGNPCHLRAQGILVGDLIDGTWIARDCGTDEGGRFVVER